MLLVLVMLYYFFAFCRAGANCCLEFLGADGVSSHDAVSSNPNLDIPSTLSRGPGAAPSTGGNSFRTQGFGSDGIAVTNTDYFEFSLSVAPGYKLNIEGIQARFAEPIPILPALA